MSRFFVALVVTLTMFASANAQEMIETKIWPNWQEMALANLTKNGQPITEQQLAAHRTLRCIRMNNYFCLMHTSRENPWNHSKGWDEALHAVFADPVWSVRAIVIDTCSKYKSNRRTAIEIADKYSPWCDTLGSTGVSVNGQWGRSCKEGPKPPADFAGRICQAPASGTPAPGQCDDGACNCPDGIARTMVIGSGLGVNDELGLFAADGTVNVARMTNYLSNLAFQETGLRPTVAVLEEGIAAAPSCRLN